MKLKKAVISILILTLVLTLFSSCNTEKNEAVSLLPVSKIVNIAVDENASKEVHDSIQIFIDKLNILSEGRLKGKIIVSKDTVSALKDGSADFAISDTIEMSKHMNDFKILNSYFYFSNLDHATMVLNSESFKEIYSPYIRDSINGIVLEAMYKDSNVLVSNQGYIGSPASFEGTEAYVNNEEEFAHVMNKLCKNVEYASSDAILSMLNSETPVVAELPIELTQKIEPVLGSRTIHIIKNAISYNYYWLTVNYNFYNTLDKDSLNIILEAKSYLSAHITLENLTRDYNFETKILSEGSIIVERDFEDLRNTAINTIKSWENFKNSWDIEKYNSVLQIIK